WIGQVVGDPNSMVSFVTTGGSVNGFVLTGGKEYQVTGTLVMEIDQSAFPRDVHPTPRMPPTGSADSAASRGALADDASTIDVLVVYTAAAAAGALGEGTTIAAEIDQSIVVTNQAYANSGISQRLRLVGSAPVGYA